jgi:hypothetical protein
MTITKSAEIPKSWGYVLANDSFLSGWGPATDKINTVILLVASYEEAMIVTENARRRSDMRRVRIVCTKPRMRQHVLYSLMNRESAHRWYEKNGF